MAGCFSLFINTNFRERLTASLEFCWRLVRDRWNFAKIPLFYPAASRTNQIPIILFLIISEAHKAFQMNAEEPYLCTVVE